MKSIQGRKTTCNKLWYSPSVTQLEKYQYSDRKIESENIFGNIRRTEMKTQIGIM